MITPTLAGTRPGGAISAAWAVMNYLGVEGYKGKQNQVTNARQDIERGVTALGYEILGTPQLGIVAFTRSDLDVFSVYKQMSKRGWFASFTTQPEALHLMLSPFHEEVTQVYLKDLTECTNHVQEGHQEKRSEVRYS